MRTIWLTCCLLLMATSALAEPKPYRLPAVDLKQPVVWGSEASTSDGVTLSFGGLDQSAVDGRPRTRLKVGDQWQELAAPAIDSRFAALQWKGHLLTTLKPRLALLRRHYFDDYASDQPVASREAIDSTLAELKKALTQDLDLLDSGVGKDTSALLQQEKAARQLLHKANDYLTAARADKLPSLLSALFQVQVLAERANACLASEPPPRTLSPLVYDPQTKLFVLFGGDHFDYLSNDLWVFDPATKQWEARHPASAPRGRANHRWELLPEGKLKLTGGYTYTNSTDYVGGQYIDLDDGDWIYDIAANRWTGSDKTTPSGERTYRSGPFHPDFYLQGPAPDAKGFQRLVADLPVNTWVATNPIHKPKLNRDWGTAVLAPDLDLMLRWSGGHSAHGGTDVLHYHLRTNRWELTAPVEFPLGQLYTNTEYPLGVSFNVAAWITGHTYQSYAYDAKAQRMWFTGQRKEAFGYSPLLGAWTDRQPKPAGMNYDSSFYTLTLTPIPTGLACWTQDGRLFHLAAGGAQWEEFKLAGDKLIGSRVDNSTLTYDAKRDRLLFFRKDYGDDKFYDGVVQTVDLKSKAVGTLVPDGAAAAKQISYLCQLRYDSEHDLVLAGCTLPKNEQGERRTPAYDCGNNRWVSLKIGGEDPSGPKGRNVSLGLMYDAQRNCFWATDTNCQVYLLRL
ncbi:MAG TPA: kelch repeat-containing protein, partial [Pirellulaceae bacterium]|nr:kelch repeat-containing protein [Pirellulaceae bacterium]